MTTIPVSVPVNLVDKLSAPLKRALRPTEALGAKVEAMRGELKKLGATRSDIEHFRKLKTGAGQTAKELAAAKDKVAELGRKLSATTEPTKKMRGEFDRARNAVRRLKDAQEAEAEQLKIVRNRLNSAGVSTKKLGEASRKLREQVGQTARTLGREEEALERLRRAQDRVATAAEKMQRRLQTAANLSLIGQGAQRVADQVSNVYSTFTNTIREVSKAQGELATLGVKDIELITARGREMQARLAGVTSASFVRAAYDIRSGISTLTDEGVADMTASAVTVAKATKALPEQMTSLFATSYGIFKKQMEDVTDGDFGEIFGAVLAKSVQQFKTDGAKMQQAIESAGAFAANLGMVMQEQMAVLGMLQTSMQAGESGTALRAFSENAAKAHQAFAKLADKSGNPIKVRILDENGQLREMPDILADLTSRYGETLDAFESAEIKNAFGTTEALKLVNTLWGQEEALRANVGALNDAAAQGAAFTAEMARAADANFDSKIVLISQQFDVLKQKIGDQLAPVIERVIPRLTAIIEKIGAWVQANPELATTIATVAAAIGGIAAVMAPVFMATSSLIGAWGAMSFGIVKLGAVLTTLSVTVLPTVGTAIAALGKLIIANPIGAAIAAIAAAAYLIYENWEPISAFFSDLWDGVKALTASAWEGLKSLFLNYTVFGLVIRHWEPITGFFDNLWGRVTATTTRYWNGLKAYFGAISSDNLVKRKWAGLGAYFSDLWGRIALKTEENWEILKALFLNYTPHGLIIKHWDGISAQFQAFGSDILDGLVAGLQARIAAVTDTVTGIADDILSEFKNILGIASPSKVFAEFGGHIMDGLINGLLAKLAELKEVVLDIGSNITGWLADQLGIRSPSRVFMALGGHLSEGLALGISSGENDVIARMARIRDGLTAPITASAGAAQPIGAGAAGVAAASPRRAEIAFASTYNFDVSIAGPSGQATPQDIEAGMRAALAAHEARVNADLRRLLND